MSGNFVSVLIPCLNEERTIGTCVRKVLNVFREKNIPGEVIVIDNGSWDNSAQIARQEGALIELQPVKGYGAAYLKGIEVARGDIIIMGDGDDTYDFSELHSLIIKIKEGYDCVIGSRFKGKILPGAMPFANRYLGNPILTGILNLFYDASISDAHSGFRAITKQAVEKLDLKTIGMEFASEMIIAAFREKLKISEIPIVYYPRQGESKLKPFSDAWRHLRFMLLFSPDWLFFIPGIILFFGGFILALATGFGVLRLFGYAFDVHSMVFFTFVALVGFQILSIGFFAKTYSYKEGFLRHDRFIELFFRCFNLEKGILSGLVLCLIGIFGGFSIVVKWVHSNFGQLSEMRFTLIWFLFLMVGAQTIFSSFFLSILVLPKRK